MRKLNKKNVSMNTKKEKVFDTPQAFIDQAAYSLSIGDAVAAIKYFTEAIRLDHTCSSAYIGRGYTHQCGPELNNKEAIKDYDKAIQYDTGDAAIFALKYRGSAKLNLGKHQMAVQDFNTLIAYTPNDAEAYLGRSKAYSKLGEKEKMLADLQTALTIDPDVLLNYISDPKFHESISIKFEESINELTQLIEQNSGLTIAFLLRGSFLYKLGEKESALQDFKIAKERGNIFGSKFYEQLCAEIEHPESPSEEYIREAYNNAASGNFQAALENLQIAKKLESQNPIIDFYLGDAKNQLLDYLGAIHDIAIYLKSGSSFALEQAHFINGYANLELANYAESIKAFDIVIGVNNKNSLALFFRGTGKLKSGNFIEAIKDFNQSLILDPYNAECFGNRGIAKIEINDLQNALLDLNSAIQLNPKLDPAYCFRGKIKFLFGDYRGAIADLNIALELFPNYALALQYRGMAKVCLRDLDNALIDLEKSLELFPENSEALNYRGKIRLLLKDHDQALIDLNRAIAIDPNNAEAYCDRGTLKGNELKDLPGAIQDFDEAIRIAPNTDKPYCLRGIAKLEKSDENGAIQDLIIAAQMNDHYAIELLKKLRPNDRIEDLIYKKYPS